MFLPLGTASTRCNARFRLGSRIIMNNVRSYEYDITYPSTVGMPLWG